MSKPSILVTGGKFVTPEHIQRMRDAGYSVRRIKKIPASQGWLRDALRGKVGYVWGGMERVTLDSIDWADRLQAIAFPGSGYTEFIPAWRELTERGVAISTSAGLNAPSVAEYAVSLMLSMLRVQPAIAPTADPLVSAAAAHELSGITVGVIGFGNIGRRVAKICSSLGMSVLATARSALQGSFPGVRLVALAQSGATPEGQARRPHSQCGVSRGS
jgi:D-3-phosphoglycerate dehydrogenase / 2-oxoglutarate reductase